MDTLSIDLVGIVIIGRKENENTEKNKYYIVSNTSATSTYIMNAPLTE